MQTSMPNDLVLDVTLYQRSETYIMSTKEGMPRLFGGTCPEIHSKSVSSFYPLDTFWEGAYPTDVADRVHTALPTFMLKELHTRITADIAVADKCVYNI